MVNMDIVWGALAGAGLGGVGGAVMGGSKWSIVGGVAGGAVLGGLVGYGISGAYWDLTHFKWPNPLAGLEKWLSGLGKALEGIPSDIAKDIEGVASAVGQAAAAAVNPVPTPGHHYTMAAVQPGSGGVGAVSPAVSPIHGTEIAVPRVVGLERNYSIEGTPLFPNIQPNYLSASQFQAALSNPGTKNPAFPGATVVQLPGTNSNTQIQGYQPNPYGGGLS